MLTIFTCVYLTFLDFLWWSLHVKLLAHVLMFWWWLFRSFYVSWIQVLYQIQDFKYLSQSVSFNSLNSVILVAKVIISMQSNLSMSSFFTDCVFYVISENPGLIQDCYNFLQYFLLHYRLFTTYFKMQLVFRKSQWYLWVKRMDS